MLSERQKHYLEVAGLVIGLVITELVIGLVKGLVMGLVIGLVIIELGRYEDTRLETELVLFAQADTAAHIAATTAI
ncbi:MAG TPA: hypothetical protein PLV03_00885 [Clostridiales bacterium]|nr:hypothetical protein [Clostridiales bacterium]